MVSKTTSSYHFRASTDDKTQQSNAKSQGPCHRTIVSLEDAATMNRGPKHVCNELDRQSTNIKVYARLKFSMDRFYLAHSWECETSGGKTKYNGGEATSLFPC